MATAAAKKVKIRPFIEIPLEADNFKGLNFKNRRRVCQLLIVYSPYPPWKKERGNAVARGGEVWYRKIHFGELGWCMHAES